MRVCLCILDPDDDWVWRGNTAHSVQAGMLLFKKDGFIDDGCVLFRNFFIYKALNYGVYTATECNVMIDNIIVADTHVGVLNILGKPSILDHATDVKEVTIKDSLFVGQSPAYDCDHLSEPNPFSIVMLSGSKGIAHCHDTYVVDNKKQCDGMAAIFMPSRTAGVVDPPFKKFGLPKGTLTYGAKMIMMGKFHEIAYLEINFCIIV